VTPWSDFWDRNYFTDLVPGLGALLRNNFARGGVTGVGLLTVMAGLAELGDVLSARREGDQPTGDDQAGPS
jgi:hypothetical protein